jgi:hypothetical protein
MGFATLGFALKSLPCPTVGILAALILWADKPDRPLGRIGRCHEFAQGVEDLLELGAGVAAEDVVVHCKRLGLAFDLRQPLCQDVGSGSRGLGVRSCPLPASARRSPWL